jgi:hypothetical protein
MRPRFQADNDLDQRILVATLRLEPAIDFKSAAEAGLHGVPDESVLSVAADEGRVLVSHDCRTMPAFFSSFVSDRNSPGLIIVSRKLAVARAADWLHLLWSASEAEEYINTIYSLP